MVVQNTGRDIGRLGIELGLKDDWLANHTMAMGSSPRCGLDAGIRGFDCGPVRSGDNVAIVLRATPDRPGSYHYQVGFYDLSGAREAIKGSDGSELRSGFDETVVPLKT
jgi:hypothetical protein